MDARGTCLHCKEVQVNLAMPAGLGVEIKRKFVLRGLHVHRTGKVRWTYDVYKKAANATVVLLSTHVSRAFILRRTHVSDFTE